MFGVSLQAYGTGAYDSSHAASISDGSNSPQACAATLVALSLEPEARL